MYRVELAVVIFFFFCVACNKHGLKNPNTRNTDDTTISTDTTPVWAVHPFNDSLPEAVFTDPKFISQGLSSSTIINNLMSLINATPKEASIYISIYLFKDEPGLLTAIRNATERGVQVHVMLDRSDDNYNASTVKALEAIDKNMDIVEVYNRIKPAAINHNKFVIFSDISTKNGDIKNVVFTSSENWVPFTEKEIQNAVIVSNDGLFNAYLQYWKKMKVLADHQMINFEFMEYDDLNDGIMAFFYPKLKDGKYFEPDPIVHILDQITDPSATTIQIEMAFWTNYRIDIINKLSDLLEEGAKVEIVVRSNQPVYNALVDLANKGAYVKMFNYSNVSGVKQVQIHSKIMLIQGEWNGKKTHLVIAGSENYGDGPLKYSNNNNILLSSYNFKYPKVFEAYEQNFDEIKMLPGVCCMTH